jgi:2-dehydropantoate 2-reductase
MRIAVVGAGGLGAYFGGRWAQAGLDVTLVARGAQFEALRARPLRIFSPLGDAEVSVRAVGDPSEAGPMDLIVVATKTFQLAAVATALAPMLHPATLVFGIQNGVEAADVLAASVGATRVLAGTCRIVSYVEEPGVVRHVGVDPIMTFGEVGGGLTDRALAVRDHLSGVDGAKLQLSERIAVDLWKKFLFFSPVSAIGGATQVAVGVWRSIDPVRELFVAGMHEVRALAAARGVAFPEQVIDFALDFLDGMPPDATSSLQRDLRDGRRTELDALCGAVVRLGAESGVATPCHATLYAALLPRELAARGELATA